MIPDKNLAFRVYDTDSKALKGVATIDLPDLSLVTGTLSGGGIAGEIDSPALGQFQSMAVTLNWQNLCDDSVKLMKGTVQKLTCYVARQEYDESDGELATSGIKIAMRGHCKSFTPGTIEQGQGSDGSSELELSYLKIYNDNTTMLEIDKLNYKFVVDGVDQLQKVRSILGWI